MILLSNCIYPNPPCQRSLWEETGALGENPDFRQSVDGLFSHESRALTDSFHMSPER
jgi:hypothetical protein